MFDRGGDVAPEKGSDEGSTSWDMNKENNQAYKLNSELNSYMKSFQNLKLND